LPLCLPGRAVVGSRGRKDGYKAGYIDKTGKFAITPKFFDASNFSEGLAAVRIGKKHGYIDKTGQMVIDVQFDAANPFREGLALVKINGVYGKVGTSTEREDGHPC